MGWNTLRLGFRLELPRWVRIHVQSCRSLRVEGLDGRVHFFGVRSGIADGGGELVLHCLSRSAFRLDAGQVVGVMHFVSCPPLDIVEERV